MDKGAHFFRCDFQVHSPRDQNWSGPNVTGDENRREFASTFIQACRAADIDAVAITDHHDMAFIPYIRSVAKAERDPEDNPVTGQIVVFPGMELTLGIPCQALLLFDADFPDDLFSLVLNALAITPADPNEAKCAEVTRLDQITSLVKLYEELDKHQYLRGRYIVLPNVSDGGGNTLLRTGHASHYKNMPCLGGYLDGGLDGLGTGNRRILSGQDPQWGSKCLAVFQTSDNRRSDFADLGKYSTWVKWATPTAEALRQACLASDSRIAHEQPSFPATAVTSINVSNSKFMGPIAIELNPQYNAIIGGRGTGKSTVLEYLRWALCDQPTAFTAEDELPDYQTRRKSLIKGTLASLRANVEIRFLVNGVPHTIRRNTESQELLLKIASAEFEPCEESDVQALLPVQAYSQKQLSNVGVRLDELTRFVHSPIRRELDQIDQEFNKIATQLREVYAVIQRKRAVEGAVTNDELALRSLNKQAEQIRRSLTGISDEDQERIAQRPLYDQAQSIVSTWDKNIEEAKEAVQRLSSQLSSFPEDPTFDLLQIPYSEVLSRLHEEVRNLFEEISTKITEIGATIHKLQSPSHEYQRARAEWTVALEKFQNQYEAAVATSTAHKSRLKELNEIEARAGQTRSSITQRRKDLVDIAHPEESYDALRLQWLKTHARRTELLEGECAELTELSNQEIRASLKRGAGFDKVVETFRKAISGSGVRQAKVEAVQAYVVQAGSPLEAWQQTLLELELFALYNPKEEGSESLPTTPILNQCGFTPKELSSLALRFTPDDWLELSLVPIEDRPIFEYRTREGDYIPFADASAGQQATSLLKTLLNQPGPPLIIDQPEDDLDNQVILEIVEQVWNAKTQRQLLFASHNANLVVNGDAELVMCCDYRLAGDHSGGKVKSEGAIDIEDLRKEITTVMEGGEEAFKLRRDKYGF
ncbi:AAA family ATPase [Acidobacteria bacterium AH-259-D05]|nr:AAA family ATPase [Acidobacteria bacterium AH-259-D05]